MRRPDIAYALSTAAVLALGLAVRAAPVLSADFPLNDGGLFSVVIEEIRRAGYRLPEFITFNAMEIPFAYPPFGFYLAALVADFARIDPRHILRLLPVAATILTVGAFFLLARAALPSRSAVVAAVAVFAVLPGSFFWSIMGGGLTRSFGLLFALLALRQAYLVSTSGSRRGTVLLAIWSGLTLLTHISLAWFLTFSTALLFLAFGRSVRSALLAAGAGVAALALAAPWWATVLLRHGVAPFLAAFQSGSVVAAVLAASLAASIEEGSSAPPGPVIPILGLVAAGVCIALAAHGDRRFFVLGWIGLTFVLNTSAADWVIAVPLSLASGYIIGEGLVPWLEKRAAHDLARVANGVEQGSRHTAAQWLTSALTIAVVGYLSLARAGPGFWSIAGPYLVPLSQEEQLAMEWIALQSPPESRFLVISGDSWGVDRSSEWFPVLARRPSVATVQGSEWLPGREFFRRLDSHQRARACAAQGAVCLDAWQARTAQEFTHVYLPKRRGEECCSALRASLRESVANTVVYDGPGATVFARHPRSAGILPAAARSAAKSGRARRPRSQSPPPPTKWARRGAPAGRCVSLELCP